MALPSDFEERRKARLQKQREERERLKKLRKLILIAVGVLVLIIIIVNISKCSSKKAPVNQPVATQNITVETPAPTESASITNKSAIPAPTSEDNDFLTILKNSGQKNHVYLTFDEGPNKTGTPQILDVLRKYNVKATFFMIGKNIEENPYLCTRVAEEGHLALPLSYSGNDTSLYAGKSEFIDEVNKTYNLICENIISSEKPFKIYRFPEGSDDVESAYKTELAKDGYYYCDWNLAIGDTSSKKTAEQLLSAYEDNKPSVNNLVIQLHDGNEATAEMLDKLIEKLIIDGYTFNRLDEIDFSNASESNSDKSTDKPSSTTTAKPSTSSGDSSNSSKSSSSDSNSSNSSSSDRDSSSNSSKSSNSSSGSSSTSSSSSNSAVKTIAPSKSDNSSSTSKSSGTTDTSSSSSSSKDSSNSSTSNNTDSSNNNSSSSTTNSSNNNSDKNTSALNAE